MPNIQALILAAGRVDELSLLTLDRPKSAVPFGGLYRVIDFALSNLMHSRIGRVGILSQYQSTSLMTHIGNGESWDMVGRHRKVSLLPPSSGGKGCEWYRGTADAVAQNMEFIVENEPDLVLILSGDHIYHMDYQELIHFHLAQKADLTVGFVKVPLTEAPRFGLGLIEAKSGHPGGRLREYQEKPAQPISSWASLTIYLFRPQVLFEVLHSPEDESPPLEFGRDILPEMVHHYRVFGYRFNGYWGYTRTLEEYWQTHMDLLVPRPKIRLPEWQIRTNLEHEGIAERQPVRVGPQALLSQVILTPGCEVEGQVRRSVLFPGVIVEKGAVVEDSILFYDTRVGAGARLHKVITDKRVSIGEGSRVGGKDDRVPNRVHPGLLSSGLTLIGHNTVVPPGTAIGANCLLYPHLDRQAFPGTSLPSGEVLPMSATLVMLLAGGVGSRLSLLVSARAKPAVPFGGNYRIIDFTLSNIMNSGLERVGVLTQYKPLSLMNHVGSGRAWDLTGRTRGITILPPQTGKKDSDWYKGTADALRQNLDFLRRYDTEQILVVSGDHIYYMDYIPMIAFHRRNRADVTVAMRQVPWDQVMHFGIGQKDGKGRIVHWEEKPKEAKSNLASTGVYLFRTDYLLKVLTETQAVDFGHHVVPQAIGQDRVFAYPFTGYWRDVGTLAFYFEAHQDLLDPTSGLNPEAWGIQTNLEEEGMRGDRPPIVIRRGARVSRSFLSSGVVIEGQVEGSILSPGVRVKKGAQVLNSIILHDGEIGAGAVLDRVILDKRVVIGEKVRVDGRSPVPNREFPAHLSEGITLIGKKAFLPPGLVVKGNCLLFPDLKEEDYPGAVIEEGMTVRPKEN